MNKSFIEWMIFLVLFIAGSIYLSLQIISIVQNGFTFIKSSGDNITLSRSESLYEARIYITIFMSLFGSLMFLLRKKAGWIVSLATYILFTAIAATGLVSFIKLNTQDPMLYVVVMILVIFLALSLMHFLPLVKRLFQVERKDMARGFMLALALILFYFFLQ